MTTGAPNRIETPATADAANVFNRLAPHMSQLDSFLHDQLAAFEPELRDVVSYCLANSGKRIRPALVFFSGWTGGGTVSEDHVRLAAVVEMIHMATLVHDDIMDDAEVRRGRETVARRFGPAAAVLLGDALFSHSLHIASQFPTTEVCLAVSAATRDVCSGEIMQTLDSSNELRSLAAYERIIELKTARLFSVSCLMGARLSAAEDKFCRAAENFGRRLGIAYQVYDDLADFFGTESEMGKTLGTDLASGKPTLPLLLLLNRLPADDADAFRDELRNGDVSRLEHRVRQMRMLSVSRDVLARVRREVDGGLASLSPWQGSPRVELLAQLARMLEERAIRLTDAG